MSKERLPGWVRKIRSEKEIFWTKVYTEYTEMEKIHFWADELLDMMRIQGEVTGDEYSGFSMEWYNENKQKEPSFDTLLKKILPKLKKEINQAQFYKRIEQHAANKKEIQKFTEKLQRKSQEYIQKMKALSAIQYSTSSNLGSANVVNEDQPKYKKKGE